MADKTIVFNISSNQLTYMDDGSWVNIVRHAIVYTIFKKMLQIPLNELGVGTDDYIGLVSRPVWRRDNAPYQASPAMSIMVAHHEQASLKIFKSLDPELFVPFKVKLHFTNNPRTASCEITVNPLSEPHDAKMVYNFFRVYIKRWLKCLLRSYMYHHTH